MKALLIACMFFLTTLAFAGENAAPHALPSVKGEVLEVRDVESYTYLRLKTSEGETWAAVGKTPVKKGALVTIENAMVMNNFESKSLKKTFKTILFGTLAATPAAMPAAAHAAKAVDTSNIKVAKAAGADARTVAEIVTHAAELKDKPVLLSGKIVKYNPGIMGKNWIHLRDGSGTESNNDILVTTKDDAKLGDVVTVKGTVRNDKDFGSGYSYKVLIEEATIQK
ncbi:MAG: nucleotide-binding protein [Proteobacteria bacterium]|nr:nucleotide-binding protein [Pseudomonadota bacterium]